MWDRAMKLGNWIIISVLALVGFAAIILTVHETEENNRAIMRQYIDSLYRDTRQTITFDSIRSVIDRRLTDSIRTIRAELDAERSARRRETQTIRRETNKLRHRLDSIGPIDRPDL